MLIVVRISIATSQDDSRRWNAMRRRWVSRMASSQSGVWMLIEVI